jgi:hypothetical protein
MYKIKLYFRNGDTNEVSPAEWENIRWNNKPLMSTLHRLDGPAVQWPTGVGLYFINGARIDVQEQFFAKALIWKLDLS